MTAMSAQATVTDKTRQIQLRVVRSGRDLREFIELPYRLYKGHPHWVPQLRLAQKELLNTKRHPFYKTADVEMFLATRGGRVAGRVMAIVNHAHNEFHGERAGFFGFFETENDPEVCSMLLDNARDWLRARGAEVMRGPVNPSTNYECGLLVEGLDSDPAVMMPYNPPYYGELLEKYGLKKAVDLYAYAIDQQSFQLSEKLRRVSERLKSRDGIRVRQVNLKNFRREVAAIRRIYNDAWSRNWGFVPVSEEEFEHLAKDLKQIVDPEIVYVAEQHREGDAEPRPVAFFLAVPDINRALKKVKDGRLLPFGLAKLLWHSRKIKAIRIITMGVIPEFQRLGIAAVLYEEVYRRGVAKGYQEGEMSWVLENNVLMNRAAELLGGRRSKTYRIYEMPVK
ncbi:MAG TPA: N-acetyltransferase [Blastocatellia bacterium]|nr:N-acetyltransferase [Blastocatellia bacterium]